MNKETDITNTAYSVQSCGGPAAFSMQLWVQEGDALCRVKLHHRTLMKCHNDDKSLLPFAQQFTFTCNGILCCIFFLFP